MLAWSRRKAERCPAEEQACDEMLLGNVAGGDKAAMHIMFARHHAGVCRFIRRLVDDPALADDLTSQVFIDAWRSANRLESGARVAAWQRSIARLTTAEPSRGQAPEAAADEPEPCELLHACMRELPRHHRDILILVYFRGRSLTEAGAMVGIADAALRHRLFHARRRLARSLMRAAFEAEPRSAPQLPFTRPLERPS